MDERQFGEDEIGGGDRWLGDGSSSDAASGSSGPVIEPTDPPVEVQHEIARLTDVARAKAAAVAVAEAELVDAVAALHPFEGQYLATWRQWVSWQCGLTSGETAHICRRAAKLDELPLITDALRTGRVSAGVADVLAQAATRETEAVILEVAEVATGRQLQQLVRDHRQARRHAKKRPTPMDDALDPKTAPSQLSYGWRDDGRFWGNWNVRPDDGAILEAALEAAIAHLRPSEADIDAGHRDQATSDDDGSAAAAGGHSSDVVEGELREVEKPRCRRSDALIGLANSFLAGEADDGLLSENTQIILHRNLTPTGARRPDGALIADLPDLHTRRRCHHCGHTDHDTDTDRDADTNPTDPTDPGDDPLWAATSLPGSGTLDPRVADLMACAALVITVEMIAGFPASTPTAVHPFNRAQRRALRARDRHCRFPGCARTRHLHAHHTRHYAHTHRTTIADGLLLCGQHHLLIHLRGYTITLGTDHCVTVTRPDGSVLRGNALPPPDTITPPPDLPTDRRHTGTGEPLTHYARDVIVEHWINTEPDPPHSAEPNAPDPDPPNDPDPP